METYFRAGASLLRNIISPQKQNLFRPNDGASHRGKAPHETKAAVRKTTHIKKRFYLIMRSRTPSTMWNEKDSTKKFLGVSQINGMTRNQK